MPSMLSPYATHRGRRRQSLLGTGQERCLSLHLQTMMTEISVWMTMQVKMILRPNRGWRYFPATSTCVPEPPNAEPRPQLNLCFKIGVQGQRLPRGNSRIMHSYLSRCLTNESPTPPLSSKSCLPRQWHSCISLKRNWLNWTAVWMKNS